MDIRRRFLSKKSSGGSSGGDSSGTYTVNLNSQWEKTTAVTNPDSSLYDGVYRSFSNYNVNSGVATMYITLTGYSTFKLYIRSYAESNYDYVMVSQLDKTITGSSSYSDTSLVKAHTRGNQQSGTALSSYTLVEYTGISSGSHTITIVYRKDGSVNNNDDRGYVLIPKEHGSSEEGGDEGGTDIDLTYSVAYTSTDNKIVTPYVTQPFNSNITSNTYNTYTSGGLFVCDSAIQTINADAFKSCYKLSTIVIPSSVTTIQDTAFYGCTGITDLVIPSTVKSLGNEAFNSCGKSSLTVECNIPSYDSWGVFYGARFKNVTIGQGVSLIGNKAFNNCEYMTSVTIPNSVRTIGEQAFYGCSKLTSVVIPEGVTSIGNSAFSQCTSIVSMTIPSSVIDLGYGFSSCTGELFVNCNTSDAGANY